MSSELCPLLFHFGCTLVEHGASQAKLWDYQVWLPSPALLSASTAPLSAAGDQGPAKYHFKIIDYGHAALHGARTKQRLPRIPFFEVVYRWALGKGDTWRLLHSMINALDGRTWHEAQASQASSAAFVVRTNSGLPAERHQLL